jgi:hypothetical protein
MVYKLITHTIKEEHFDHPLALEAINGVKLNGNGYTNGYTNGNPNGNPNGNGVVVTETAMYVPGTISVFNTEPAVTWRMDQRTIWARYLWRLRNYITSALHNGEDLAVVEEQLFQNIDEIGDSVRSYYGLVASKQLAQYMRSFVLTVLEIVQTLKKGGNIDALVKKVDAELDDFANFAQKANPDHWPADVVKSIFGKALQSWIEQCRARVSKNWPADIEAVDTAHRIILAGQDDDTPAFSDIFAKGIILQFPDRFLEAQSE